MAHSFLEADEVAFLQGGITLEEARVACADLGLSSEGTVEALRQRLCAHYEVGSGGAAADSASRLSRQGSAPPPPGSRMERVSSLSRDGATTTAPRAVVRCGWLEKKGGQTYIDDANVLHKERHFSKGGRRNWKQRWFALFSDGELHYYTSEPPEGAVLPPDKTWKGSLQLVGVEEPFIGRPCCWHVRDSSPDELLLSLPGGSGMHRSAILLRSDNESERQGWIAATARTFGSKVEPLLHSAEERGMAETSLMAIRAKLGRGGETLDVASTLPPNKAIVMFDFAAQEPQDLALTRGAVVVLTQTEGEWWQGHIATTPGAIGAFPASYVARGTGVPQTAHSTKASLPPPVGTQDRHQQRLQIAKGSKGFGMGIEDDGTVSTFTFGVHNPAKSAGVQIGTRIVAVDGVATKGKPAIVAELQRRAHQTSVEFTFDHSAVPAPAAAIPLPEPQPELPVPFKPPVPRSTAAVGPPLTAAPPLAVAPSVPAVPAIPNHSYTATQKAVLRRGWLEKKGGDTHIDLTSNVLHKERHYSKGGRRTWKPRWFIVYEDGELAYFKSGPVEADDPLWHEGEPDASALKGRLQLTSTRGGCCSWHVRQKFSPEFLLALPADVEVGGGKAGNGSRRGLLLRHEEESEQQLWIEATKRAFGATVSPFIEPAEERGLDDLAEVAARLPSTEAVALYDFDAERADDLGLKTGAVVVLTDTKGEWWQGHVVGNPGVVGLFPATFVARGQRS